MDNSATILILKQVTGLVRFLVINPKDEEALKRIINYPSRGIGLTTMQKISITANNTNTSIWQIINNINLDKDRSEGFSSIGNYIIYNTYENEFSNAKLAIMNSDKYIYKDGYLEFKIKINNEGLKKIIRNLLRK